MDTGGHTRHTWFFNREWRGKCIWGPQVTGRCSKIKKKKKNRGHRVELPFSRPRLQRSLGEEREWESVKIFAPHLCSPQRPWHGIPGRVVRSRLRWSRVRRKLLLSGSVLEKKKMGQIKNQMTFRNVASVYRESLFANYFTVYGLLGYRSCGNSKAGGYTLWLLVQLQCVRKFVVSRQCNCRERKWRMYGTLPIMSLQT